VDAAGLRVHNEQAAVGRRTTAAGVNSLEMSGSFRVAADHVEHVRCSAAAERRRNPEARVRLLP
jgi:hypothetical protein